MNPRPIMLVSGHVRPLAGDLPVGGAARQALKLTRALRAQGAPARVVTFRPTRSAGRGEVVESVPVDYVDSLYWLFRRRGLRRIEALVRVGALLAHLARRRHTFDLIHIHTAATATALAGVLAGRWLGKPTVLKVTNSGERFDLDRFAQVSGLPAAGRLGGWLRRATCAVAMNAEAARQLAASGFRPEQIVQIPNGVEAAALPPRSSYAPRIPFNLVYTGRLHPSKGLDGLLRALHRLPAGPAWRLSLVGGGPGQAGLRALASELGISDRVTFAGEVADVLPFLQSADGFVLPSRSEGMSNALLEAMAVGLPCVASDNAGNRSLIAHGETGWLVPVDNIDALAGALARLMGNMDERERLGRAARRQVESRFDIAHVAEAYARLYGRLLASGGESPASDFVVDPGRGLGVRDS